MKTPHFKVFLTNWLSLWIKQNSYNETYFVTTLMTKFLNESRLTWPMPPWDVHSAVQAVYSHSCLLLPQYLMVIITKQNTQIFQHESFLTGGNWQKWKRVFLTCHCHKIYKDEAVGLKSCKNTWKITIFVKMWNLGQYRENLIFLSITA